MVFWVLMRRQNMSEDLLEVSGQSSFQMQRYNDSTRFHSLAEKLEFILLLCVVNITLICTCAVSDRIAIDVMMVDSL